MLILQALEEEEGEGEVVVEGVEGVEEGGAGADLSKENELKCLILYEQSLYSSSLSYEEIKFYNT